MSSLQSLDIALRSATTTPSPQVRTAIAEVAKLIDVSSCIGCKACQVACMQWNDLRDEVGDNIGTYDNPRDLTPESWTVMRFSVGPRILIRLSVKRISPFSPGLTLSGLTLATVHPQEVSRFVTSKTASPAL